MKLVGQSRAYLEASLEAYAQGATHFIQGISATQQLCVFNSPAALLNALLLVIVSRMGFLYEFARVGRSVDFTNNRTCKLLHNTQTLVHPYESR